MEKKKMRRMFAKFTVLILSVVMIMVGTTVSFADEVNGGTLEWGVKVETTGWYGCSSPVLYGDDVYVISYDKVFRYGKDTGELEGSVELTSNIGYSKTPATAGDGKLFIQTNGGYLEIIDISGDEMELEASVRFDKRDGVSAYAPVVYSEKNNAVYTGSYSRNSYGVYARIDLEDNEVTEIIGTDKRCNFYWMGAYADSDLVIIGSDSDDQSNDGTYGDATLFAYDKKTGKINSMKLADSGSIRSYVVKNGDAYYFTAKNKKLYKAEVDENGDISADVFADISGITTCTPVISGEKIYVGSQSSDYKGQVDVIDLSTGKICETYRDAPADIKNLIVKDGRILSTYNKKPGGIWDVASGRDYFVPDENMQQFCISSLCVDDEGVIYYTNDSSYLMAVKPEEKEDTDGAAGETQGTENAGSGTVQESGPDAGQNGHTGADGEARDVAGAETSSETGDDTLPVYAAVIALTALAAAGAVAAGGRKKRIR